MSERELTKDAPNPDEASTDDGGRKGLRGRFSRRSLIALAASTAALGVPLRADARGEFQAAVPVFDSDDLSLLTAVLALEPRLLQTAIAVKLSRVVGLNYPIANHAALQRVFRRAGGQIDLAGHKIDWPNAKRFLPRSFFPIRSEHDLMTKVAIGLQRGDFHHSYERFQGLQLRAAKPASSLELPSPTASPHEPVWFDHEGE